MSNDEDTRSEYLLAMKEECRGYGDGPMGTHRLKIDLGRVGVIQMNPFVSLFASILVWSLAIACMAAPEDMATTLKGWQSGVTDQFTWLYISSNGIWFFFIIVLYYYYGDIKLGHDDEKPEFDDANYFVLIFTAGIAIGLFFYGVSEPMYHYLENTGANRFNAAGYLNDNEKATAAINLTIYHWGVHGWVVYSLTAICLGVLSFRYDLPLTYRTCFFPVFGKVTWGWIGDLIDGCTIAGCIAGVCTSLGLGAQQIVTGMMFLGWIDPTCAIDADGNMIENGRCLSEGDVSVTKCLVIVAITLAATVSVLSGLDNGIKLLSQIAFTAGMILWVVVFILDDTWYILNVLVQTFGVYLQWIIQLGWYTDAYGQLGYGEGRAIDSIATDTTAAVGTHKSWMDWWTIFYWGWWIAWSPFVGMFLARISKGRTVKEVINFTFSIPLVYCIMWFGTFGGSGIRMHRRAELLQKAGTDLYNADIFYKLSQDKKRPNCYEVPASLPCPTAYTISKGINDTDSCSKAFPYIKSYTTNVNLSPVCSFIWNDSDSYWFDLMNQYYGLGGLLCTFSMFAITIYFVTSSDSGSLVVDYISNNGEEAHAIQRVYWALTEGFLAICLLLAGGSDSLQALRSVSIVSGVPLTIFVCFICLSTQRVFAMDKGYITRETFTAWKVQLYGGIFDYIEFAFSMGKSPLPDQKHIMGFVIASVAPSFCIFKTLSKMPNRKEGEEGMKTRGDWALLVISIVCWVAFVGLAIADIAAPDVGLRGLVGFMMLGVATCILAVRFEVRVAYNIEGGGIRDCLASFFCYNTAAYQMMCQVEDPPEEKVKGNYEPTAETVGATHSSAAQTL